MISALLKPQRKRRVSHGFFQILGDISPVVSHSNELHSI